MQLLKGKNKTQFFVVSIYFIAVLIISISLLQFWNYRMVEHAKAEKGVLEKVKQTYLVVWEKIAMSDLGVRGFVAVTDPKMLLLHNKAMASYQESLDAMEKVLDNQLIFDDFNVMDDWRAFRKQYEVKMDEAASAVRLIQEQKFEEAREIIRKDTGEILFIEHYKPLYDKLYSHLEEHAVDADETQQAGVFWIGMTQGLLLFLALPNLIVMFIQLKKSNKERKRIFSELETSNQQLIFDDGDQITKVVEEKAIFGRMLNNLEKTAHFIKEITEGNYDIQWEGLTENTDKNQGNIAGRLVRMRDKMQAVRKGDQLRIWSTEGHALFTEITRRNQKNPTEMYVELVSQLVKYLNVNQAGLFVLQQEGEGEEQEYLKLVACYAFDRRKYLQSKIFPGDGLVGQVFLEGESVNLREVPDNYIQITSGLGDASPRALLLVPVKYNSQVVGILELASFKPFDENVVKFVEEVGNILGATLIANQTNAVTQKLLKTTQEQAEELRLQEEEMRQNMEELEATQEEMRRQHRELESENQVLKQEKAALQQSATVEHAPTK